MHYFYTYKSNSHHLSMVNNLISLGLIDIKNITIVRDDDSKKSIYQNAIAGKVQFIDHKNISLKSCDTFSVIGLNKFTAPILKKIIQNNIPFLNNFYFIATDDEIASWFEIQQKNKEKDFLLTIDEETSFCLKSIKRFICEDFPWGQIITNNLNLNVKLINALPPFTVLTKDIEDRVCSDNAKKLRSAKSLKIMLYTKKKEQTEVIELIQTIRKSNLLNEYPEFVFTIFGDPVTKNIKLIFEILMLKLILRIKKVKFKFIYLNDIPRDIYFRYLISQDVLFCQPRGGCSAIRAFIKSGGTPVFQKNSLNFSCFKKHYNESEISVYSKNKIELNLLNTNKTLKNMLNHESSSITKLGKIYD